MICKVRQISNALLLALSLGLLAAVALGIVTAKAPVSARAGGDKPTLAEIACRNGCVYQSDHGSYYTGVQAMTTKLGKLKHGAVANYDERSVEGIKAFAQANRDYGKEAFARNGEIRALVTFSRPLPANRFRTLIGRPDVTVQRLTIRSVVDGVRVTTFGTPDNGDAAGEQSLKRMGGKGAEAGNLKGVISAEVTLTASGYQGLISSPDVYMIDLSDAMIRNELAGQYEPLDVILNSPYWFMENLGMVKE